MTEISLTPEAGIALTDDRMSVVSSPGWLRITPIEALSKRRWVRIRYSSGMFDPLTRPILRLRTEDGRLHYNFMNGAILGSAEWIGRIPKNTIEASISPTHHLGPFSFRIDRIQAVNRLELLARGLVTNPRRTYASVRKRLINARQSSWDLLKYNNAATPFARYQEWHRRLVRPVDLAGFDRPRHNWSKGPEVLLFAELSSGTPGDVQRTLHSLQAQLFTRWRLLVAIDEATPEAARTALRKVIQTDERVRVIEGRFDWGAIQSDALVATISIGDRLRETALASFVDATLDHPEWQAVYCDEDSFSGLFLHSPILKPDWSPVLNRTVDYVGRLICLRASLVGGYEDVLAEPSKLLAKLPPHAIGHLRRILYQRHRTRAQVRSPKHEGPVKFAAVNDWPGVSVIVPTRDRPELLETCLEGLQKMTDYPDLEVVIVDNGTNDPRALSMLNAVHADPRFKVIRDDGPFNYSRLCNAGVRASTKPYLTFLNNDIIMRDRNWLKALIRVCRLPRAGVVGAKLLFPNSRLQHAGVVLGVAGVAGHAYFHASEESEGYLSELRATREVSAVTGACCAVERAKFLAVGGLDEVNYPVELNDIDLCLRVAEQGWQNYWTPEAGLIHLQAASRGRAERPSDRYAHERTQFLDRWAQVVRDDPFFHPALSLFAHRPALG